MPFPHAPTYVPGSTTALVADGSVLFVEADPAGPLVSACRTALAAGPGVDGVLGVLADGQPAFALTALEGEALRVVVAGHAQVEFAGGVATTLGTGGAGRLDQRLDTWPDLRLSLADPARPIDPSWPALPIEAGTVLAIAVVVPAGPPRPASGPAADTADTAAPMSVAQMSGAPTGVDPDATTGQFLPGPPPESPTVVAPLPSAYPQEWQFQQPGGAQPAPAQPPAYVEQVPAGDSPMVQAVMCANSHLNAPFVVGACRVCGAPVPAQVPFLAPRPLLGVLVLPSGETVPVDRDVLLGRAPFSVDSVDGADPRDGSGPRLVALPSPNNDLSRTHVRVAVDGWLVQVTDLGSTNGTVATMPGQQGVRLRPHEPFVLVPSTVLDLAAEALVRFEVPG